MYMSIKITDEDLLIMCTQVEKHYATNSLNPEMLLEKLQLITTSNASPEKKVQWLVWWNSSSLTRAARKFPASPVSENTLKGWLDKACWYAGVSPMSMTALMFFALNFCESEIFLHLLLCLV